MSDRDYTRIQGATPTDTAVHGARNALICISIVFTAAIVAVAAILLVSS